MNKRVSVGRPRPLVHALALALAITGWAAPLGAQESQVPFDARGRVEVVNADLARRLGIFHAEYEGFSEARLFQSPDSSVSLEVLVRRDGRLERIRVPLTPDRLAEVRRVTDATLGSDSRRAGPEQNVRFRLLVSTSLLGLFAYGPALPIALDVDDPSAATGLYLLTASASYFVPWMLTHDQHVTPAMAGLGVYGSTRGFLHGAALHYLLTGYDEGRDVCDEFGNCEFEDDFPKPGAFAFGIATGVAEGVGGYLWSKRSGMTHGKASAIGLGGDWGMINGFLLAEVLGLDSEENVRPSAGLALVGAAGGIAAGRAVADRRDYTHGDVQVAGTTGLLGAFTAGTLMDLAGLDETRPAAAGRMAGAAAGLAAGDALVRATEFSSGEATLVRLGTLAGGLMGLGLGVLAESDGGEGTLTSLTTTAGALAGFALSYRRALPAARESSSDRSSLQLHLAPQGLVGLVAPGTLPTGGSPAALLNIRYRFR